jgi:lipopolysaccharide/colanic/teichoic acid biosynthesis glycosyltransferase
MSLEQGERRWGRLSRHHAADATPRVARPELVYARTKRALDFVLSGGALLVLSPFLVIISLAIRLTSPGTALIRQERLGRGRSPFMMLKFRTMYRNVDDSVHREYIAAMFNGDAEPSSGTDGIYKLVDDPRITRVGRLLRRTSLDELPQLINVAIGDMSLVGPRPILPYEAELLEEKDAIRFDVLPGITGLWQVSGRNALTMPQALELDAEYVRRRSLGLDVRIFLKTIPVMLTGRGAG